uniref:Condensin-2 complex subunit H2 n=1 Tax=Mus spicilegus TaxID=10103 RepID=A0A8C6H8M9_MUSSI
MDGEEFTKPHHSSVSSRFRERITHRALEPASRLHETPDPWQSLDHFDSLDSKPFKKGKPYSVPPGVEEAPGQKCKRKDATELQDFHQWYLNVYVKHTDGRRAWQKGPTFADMDILYWEHEKEWLETLQKLRRCKIMERWKDLWLTDEDRLEESLEDPGVADDFLEPKEYAEEPEGEMPGETELVKRNVELFIATSRKLIQETELSQRIRDWEDKIQPLLHEEQHVPFDIHTYGDQLASWFPQLNESCPFSELLAGQPAFEVCRSMLATLQLITQQPGLEAAVDTMSLRLLTHQQAHSCFQTYTAPSMAQPSLEWRAPRQGWKVVYICKFLPLWGYSLQCCLLAGLA